MINNVASIIRRAIAAGTARDALDAILATTALEAAALVDRECAVTTKHSVEYPALRDQHRAQIMEVRGLHSSTFQPNLSRFLPLTPPTDAEYPTKRAYVEPKRGRVSAPDEGGGRVQSRRAGCGGEHGAPPAGAYTRSDFSST